MIDEFPMGLPHWGGRKKRKVYVYVPDGAEEGDRFPVLYMFDGHNVFFDEDATYGKSWGLKEYMEETGMPMMIVAVDCDHRRDYARLKEYSPFDFEEKAFGKIEGRGDLFMEWLCGQLKPFIDEHYPTLPGRETTFIAGSSMGGLMTLWAVIRYNAVFSRGAALSPSIWVSPQGLREAIRRTDFLPTTLYMDYGARELGNHKRMLRSFARTAEELMAQGVAVTSRIVPGGEHCEACWEEQVPFFMHILEYDGFGADRAE